jgi:RNase H-fold protein (predicted Holliday junction resolvase)
VIEEYQVKQILVGLSEGVSAQKARQLGEKIAQLTHLSVVYTDETLSTKIATRKLSQAGKKIDQKSLDHFAAAEFLQEWFENWED